MSIYVILSEKCHRRKTSRLPFGDHGNPPSVRGRPERVGGGRQGGEGGGGRRQKSLLPLPDTPPRPPKKMRRKHIQL